MSETSRAPAPSYATLPRLASPPATVLDHLDARFPHVGRAVWAARMAAGEAAFDDGERLDPSTPYRPGARIRYFRAVEAEPAVPFAEEILHADDDLLVADKPPFLPVTPGGGFVNECLLYRLRRRTGLAELVPLHRLDRDTAGLVLCAATVASRRLYGPLFQERRVSKEYLALGRVEGEPAERVWEVENRLEGGEPFFRMQVVPGPANAFTRVELLALREGVGLFRLRPRTGRKHQLRVHLAALGFPILNDRCYPTLLPEAPPDPQRPLELLAHRLAFRDPKSGEMRRFESRRRLSWQPSKGV